MFNNSLKLCLIALLTLGLAFTTACGGDDDDNNGNNSNPDLNNDNNSNPNNSNPNNSNPNNSNPNNSNPNNSNPNNNTGGDNKTFCEENPTAERCTADPAEFAFGAFSNITKFEIANDECCFDFGGDNGQDIDNRLGFLLSMQLGENPPMMDSVNETIAENIADGTLALILEHDGLTDLSAGGDYTVNFFLGKYDGEDLLINPASFEQGAQPLAYLPGANLTGTALEAGPGNVMLSLELFGANLDLSIRQARITAQVDEASSSIEDGVTLTTGKLGGLIVVNEVLDAINSFADTCECIPLEGAKLIEYNDAGVTCHASVDKADPTHTCDAEEPCGMIASNCALIPLIAGMADQTVGGADEPNAISVGATFEAEAVTVAGIAAE